MVRSMLCGNKVVRFGAACRAEAKIVDLFLNHGADVMLGMGEDEAATETASNLLQAIPPAQRRGALELVAAVQNPADFDCGQTVQLDPVCGGKAQPIISAAGQPLTCGKELSSGKGIMMNAFPGMTTTVCEGCKERCTCLTTTPC